MNNEGMSFYTGFTEDQYAHWLRITGDKQVAATLTLAAVLDSVFISERRERPGEMLSCITESLANIAEKMQQQK